MTDTTTALPLSRILRTASLTLLAFIIGGDLAGVVISFGIDVGMTRSASSLALWMLWLVLGIFAGLGAQMQAVDALVGEEKYKFEVRPGAREASFKVVLVFAAELALITLISGALFWTDATEGIYVPDNRVATILFFGAMLGAAVFAHRLFHLPGPSPLPAKGGEGQGEGRKRRR